MRCTCLYQVAATDRDAGSNANITYTISSGNHGNVFSIDEISGQIKVATVLDRETRSRYELVIAAADGKLLVCFLFFIHCFFFAR